MSHPSSVYILYPRCLTATKRKLKRTVSIYGAEFDALKKLVNEEVLLLFLNFHIQIV